MGGASDVGLGILGKLHFLSQPPPVIFLVGLGLAQRTAAAKGSSSGRRASGIVRQWTPPPQQVN